MAKKKRSQAKEIVWNIVNSLIAGVLVLLGALTDGQITKQGLFIACVAGGIVAFTQFKDFWATERKEYCVVKPLAFIHF